MKIEVKEGKINKVDWTKNPQLVINEIGLIIKTARDQSKAKDNTLFVGIPVNDLTDHYSITAFNCWTKETFHPFHGEITLKNDWYD